MLKVIQGKKSSKSSMRVSTDIKRLNDIQSSINEIDDERLRIILQEAWDRAVSCKCNGFGLLRKV